MYGSRINEAGTFGLRKLLAVFTFRFIISIFVLPSILGHALLGCCWHHGHSFTEGEIAMIERDQSSNHHHCSKTKSDSPPENKERHEHESDEENCEIVISLKKDSKFLSQFVSKSLLSFETVITASKHFLAQPDCLRKNHQPGTSIVSVRTEITHIWLI